MRLAILFFIIQTIQVTAWTMHPARHPLIMNNNKLESNFLFMTKEEPNVENQSPPSEESNSTSPEQQWGKSYIGGDPCGSKYNDDPFDAASTTKPGLPDDMKARIEAMAKQKLKDANDRRKLCS